MTKYLRQTVDTHVTTSEGLADPGVMSVLARVNCESLTMYMRHGSIIHWAYDSKANEVRQEIITEAEVFESSMPPQVVSLLQTYSEVIVKLDDGDLRTMTFTKVEG